MKAFETDSSNLIGQCMGKSRYDFCVRDLTIVRAIFLNLALQSHWLIIMLVMSSLVMIK